MAQLIKCIGCMVVFMVFTSCIIDTADESELAQQQSSSETVNESSGIGYSSSGESPQGDHYSIDCCSGVESSAEGSSDESSTVSSSETSLLQCENTNSNIPTPDCEKGFVATPFYDTNNCLAAITCTSDQETGCDNIYDPVCVYDSFYVNFDTLLVYEIMDNACFAESSRMVISNKRNCTLLRCSIPHQPPEDYCPEGEEFHSIWDDWGCPVSGGCEPKLKDCTNSYEPICGIDGVTYSNECTIGNVKMDKAYWGECDVVDTLKIERSALDFTDTLNIKEGIPVIVESENVLLRIDSIKDSRCAEGSLCVWEGDGVVSFTLTKNAFIESFTLHTHTDFAQELLVGEFKIKLISLDSYVPEYHYDEYKARYEVGVSIFRYLGD
ncbi:MAG: Kazal-type serine protease inhibitor domain-containing protein [Fibrobacterales bacterium]